MRFNFDDDDLEDDGLSAEDLEIIDNIRDFFFSNFKRSDDPIECTYYSTKEVFEMLMKAYPASKLSMKDVEGWLSSSFSRKNIGDGNIKIVWAIYKKAW